jgi:hypothetical protein
MKRRIRRDKLIIQVMDVKHVHHFDAEAGALSSHFEKMDVKHG